MVRKTHPGRRGYPGLSDTWGEDLAEAATITHTADCTIHGPDTQGVFDPNTGTYTTTAGPLRYSGKCRIQRVREDQVPALVTEQALATVKYRVSVAESADTVRKGDLITIGDSEDGQMNGQRFPVQAVIFGSLRVQRELYCSDDLSV